MHNIAPSDVLAICLFMNATNLAGNISGHPGQLNVLVYSGGACSRRVVQSRRP